MRYLVVRNPGEIEEEAIRLLGVSSKRGTSSIGQFGTGNKYAIATLLRTGHSLGVHSGGKKWEFRLDRGMFRGAEYSEVVLVQGQKRTKLGFAQELGLQWQVEDALRELFSNAFDEGEMEYTITVGEPSPKKGHTQWWISLSPEAEDFYSKVHKWFRQGEEALDEGPGWKILPTMRDGVGRIYRRGVLALELGPSQSSIWDWDFTDLEVKEDRRADRWKVEQEIATVYQKGGLTKERKQELLRQLGIAKELLEERSISSWRGLHPSWLEALDGKIVLSPTVAAQWLADVRVQKTPHLLLPDNWASPLLELGAKGVDAVVGKAGLRSHPLIPREQLTEKERENLRVGIETLRRWDLWKDWNVEPYDSQDKPLLGYALLDEQVIGVSRQSLATEESALRTLLEEATHLLTGFKDNTRELENYLFERWLEQLRKA